MAEQNGANVNQSPYFDSDRSYRKAVAAELIAALDEGCVWELAAKLQQMGRIKHDLPLRPGARQASNSRQQAQNLTLSTSVLPSQQSAEHSQQQQQQQQQQQSATPPFTQPMMPYAAMGSAMQPLVQHAAQMLQSAHPALQFGMQTMQPGMQLPGMQPMQPMQPIMQPAMQPGVQASMQPNMQANMLSAMTPYFHHPFPAAGNTGLQPGLQGLQPGLQPGLQQASAPSGNVMADALQFALGRGCVGMQVPMAMGLAMPNTGPPNFPPVMVPDGSRSGAVTNTPPADQAAGSYPVSSQAAVPSSQNQEEALESTEGEADVEAALCEQGHNPQEQPHADDGSGQDVAANPAEEGAATATTLILRNLPPSFDQQVTRKWVEEHGYENLFDFLLWFPAKATSRLNSCGYAFINFISVDDAQRFRREMHLMRFPNSVLAAQDGTGSDGGEAAGGLLPLSVAIARVQGFVDNFTRFKHLLGSGAATRCCPYFAKEAVDNLGPEEEASATAESAVLHVPEGPITTVVIRNLPPSVETQDVARQWLDTAGYAKQYDFFLYLPAKRTRRLHGRNPAAPLHGYGYAFVNFRRTETAEACIEALSGTSRDEGDPLLNVVGAKIQGLEQCIEHFRSLNESGRCTPWLASSQGPVAKRAVYQ